MVTAGECGWHVEIDRVVVDRQKGQRDAVDETCGNKGEL